MKKLLTILIITVVSLGLSCSKEENRNSEFMKPIKIVIPSRLINNYNIVNVVHKSEKEMNIISDRIETLVYENKIVGDLNPLKKELLQTKLALELDYANNEMSDLLDEFNDFIKTEQLLGKIDNSDYETLVAIERTFKFRKSQIDTKYGMFLDKMAYD